LSGPIARRKHDCWRESGAAHGSDSTSLCNGTTAATERLAMYFFRSDMGEEFRGQLPASAAKEVFAIAF
jgi:hypothetical protein